MFVAGNFFASFSEYDEKTDFVLRQREEMADVDNFHGNAATLEATIKGFYYNESEIWSLFTVF